ncbi:hypothetical protein [Pseudoalteromonas sp. SA25]|uniref:hypothetical protein n=1 Tax=Pseudoalteromonas sp. SA25 TaxID=2686347 RepID=UPI0013FD944D|nr:hypothetical protein [Pseudoalteromonas sp. SA25]
MKTTVKEKSKRGGKRVGAGRPKTVFDEKKAVRIDSREELLINLVRSNGNLESLIDENNSIFIHNIKNRSS